MRRVRHDTSVVRGLMHTETYSRLLVTMWPAGESGARDVFAVVDGARTPAPRPCSIELN